MSCLLLSNSSLLAQQTANSSANHQYTSGSVLSAEDKIDAVYGASFFDGKEDIYDFFIHLIEERMHYKYLEQSPDEKFPLITANGYTDIQPFPGYQGFDASNFNPLWYQIDFYAHKKKVYRIDNSDYLLVIAPQ